MIGTQGLTDVCKVTVFYRNIADRGAVNRVRREYFGSTRPASTAVEVSRLVKDDLLVEIEVIAVRPPAAVLAPGRGGSSVL